MSDEERMTSGHWDHFCALTLLFGWLCHLSPKILFLEKSGTTELDDRKSIWTVVLVAARGSFWHLQHADSCVD